MAKEPTKPKVIDLRYNAPNHGIDKTVKVQIRNPKEKLQSLWISGTFYESGRNSILQRCAHSELGYRGGTFIDIGANIGNHTLFFASVCEADKVMAFEPEKECYDHLTDNMDLNLPFKWYAINEALGDKSKKVGLFKSKAKPEQGGQGMTRINPKGRSIDQNTLDSHTLDLEECKLIKIDVEGYELNVLKGAKETLKRLKPDVFVEIQEPDDLKKVTKWMEGQGYHRLSTVYNHTPTYLFQPTGL